MFTIAHATQKQFSINFYKHSKKMKKYIKPEIKAQFIELENRILDDSINVGIGEDPATGPALSKGNFLFFSDDDDDQGSPSHSSSSLWDD